jgi:hypothetical protein
MKRYRPTPIRFGGFQALEDNNHEAPPGAVLQAIPTSGRLELLESVAFTGAKTPSLLRL